MSKLLKFLCVLAVAGVASVPGAAFAHGHGGTHVFLGFNVGYPAYYYAPPPYYYYPPPVVYTPPPAVYYTTPPAPTYAAPAAAAPAQNCRTFNGDATIDASGQAFYGTACYGADGRWHVTQ